MLSLLILTLLNLSPGLVQSQEVPNGKDFTNYIGKLMTDDSWKEFIWAIDIQHRHCFEKNITIAVSIKLEDYMGKEVTFFRAQKDKLLNQPSIYVSGQFSTYMSSTMDDATWRQLLSDINEKEIRCKLGVLGGIHVDLPYYSGLTKDYTEELEFYVQQYGLLTGQVRRGKEHFTAFMSRYMNGRAWYEMLLHMNDQAHLCHKESGNKTTPHAIETFLDASADEFNDMMSKVINDVKISVPNKYRRLPIYQKFADFMNSHMTDKGWKAMIWELSELETTCPALLKKKNLHFDHVNLAYYAGLSGNAAKSMELMEEVAQLMTDDGTKKWVRVKSAVDAVSALCSTSLTVLTALFTHFELANHLR
jgi:hypothetical protein